MKNLIKKTRSAKKVTSIISLFILSFSLIMLMSVYSCSSDEIAVDSQINKEGNINKRVSDFDFNIFSVTSKDVVRKDFPSIKRWYSEGENTQVFQLYKGDFFNGERSNHARTEAGQGLKWKNDNDILHTFQATYSVSTDSKESLAIAQIFAGSGTNPGPQLIIHIRSDGSIDYGSRGNGSQVVDTGNWKVTKENPKRKFKIKLEMRKGEMVFYFNGKEKFRGPAELANDNTANNHFRWGVYSNNKVTGSTMDADAKVTVTGLSRS